MEKVYIAIRLPGFYARIEKKMLPDSKGKSVIVSQGSDQRSLVLSVCEKARMEGIKPGIRLGDIDTGKVVVVESAPGKYLSEIRCVEDIILEEIPDVQYMRPGLFIAKWDGIGRFLESHLKRLISKFEDKEMCYSLGIASEAGLAELAAMRAGEKQIVRVEKHEIGTFLSNTPLHLLYDIPKDKVQLLKEMGIVNCAELAMLPDHSLVTLFGREGVLLKNLLITGKRIEGRREWRKAIRLTEKITTEDELRDKVYDLLHGKELQENLYGFVKTVFYLTLVYSDGKRSSGSFKIEKDIFHEGKLSELLWLNVKAVWKRRVQIAEVRLRVIPGELYSGQMDIFGEERSSIRNQALMNSISELRTKWGKLSVRFANNPIQPRERVSSC